MNWEEYKQWLEENILQKTEVEEENDQEDNDENKTNLYTLRPEVKTKYSISQEKEIIAALTSLITNIENNKKNLFISSSSHEDSSEENNYHSLPILADLINQKNQAITWNQLFPNRAEAFFGAKTNTIVLDRLTFTALGKIFNDWAEEHTRIKRLTNALDKEEVMAKFLIEAVISLNYDLIRKKRYDKQLKAWAEEYEKLSSEEQGKLADQKIMVDKFLAAFREESSNRPRQSESSQPANSSWDWKEISKWSLVGLIILIGLLFIKKLWKGANVTTRQDLLQTCQVFLSQVNRQKKDYRAFAGNVKKLSETSRIQALTPSELNTCQKIQQFLKKWQENYAEHPKIYSRDEELDQLQERFNKWLESSQKKTNVVKPPKFNFNNHNSDWEDKLERAEKGLQWLEWWEKYQTTIKFAGAIIGLLFAWLIIEKTKEKFR